VKTCLGSEVNDKLSSLFVDFSWSDL